MGENGSITNDIPWQQTCNGCDRFVYQVEGGIPLKSTDSETLVNVLIHR